MRATSSLRMMGPASNAAPIAREDRLVNAIVTALRKERVLDREGGVFDDECILHARPGDEELFNDLSDFLDYLKGYVIIPVEEYSKLGGNR